MAQGGRDEPGNLYLCATMADRVMETVCRRCGSRGQMPVFDIINTAESPELKERLLSGELFVWECPHCSARNLVGFPLLYHDPALKLLMWLSDGSDELERQMEAAFEEQDLPDYTARMVDSPGELMEKIKIFEAGLDDITMEMCKFITRQDLQKNVELKFFGMDGPDHTLTFAYPENRQMQMAETGFEVYEDCAGIIRRNPAVTESARGLVRVNREWLERFIA